MIRSSRHILKFSNKNKLLLLDKTYNAFMSDLKVFVDLLWSDDLILKKLLSSKDIPSNLILHSQWKQIAYKQASEIVRGQLEVNKQLNYKRFKKIYSYFSKKNRQTKFLSKKFSELKLNPKKHKPDLKNTSINIDNRLFDIKEGNSFNEFVLIRLPFFKENVKRAISVNLPIKHHKHSLKYTNWNRKNTLRLIKKKDDFYIEFIYEKNNPVVKLQGDSLGIDIGYNKLLTTSRNEKLGLDINNLYLKLKNKKQGSINYNNILTHRNNLINKTVNELNLENISRIVIEDIKGLKRKGKLGRWVYRPILKKIENKAIEQGITLEKVSPEYTSQECSKCGFIHRDNRVKELFKCIKCNYEDDADYNASLNILRRGVNIIPLTQKDLK